MKQLPSPVIASNSLVRKSLTIGLVTALIGLSGITVVRAQEVLPSAPTQIQIQPPLTDQITDLKAQYRAELETYRGLERQTSITKQQYQQLKTLVSLETAITTLKKTMASRAKVLELYLRLLRLELINATGVELTAKQQLEDRLDTAIEKIITHQAEITTADDRESLNMMADQFSQISPELETLAYQIQAQLVVSRLQTVYDKVQLVKVEVKDQTASQAGALQQSARERAFMETDRNLEEVQGQLSSAQGEINSPRGFTNNSLRNIMSTSESIYSGLSQSLNFISELAGISFNDR